jgi:hypothetical protein
VEPPSDVAFQLGHSDSSPASRSALTSANAAAARNGKNAPRARASLAPSTITSDG